MTGSTRTYTQLNEKRHFKCTFANAGGTFTLTFRSVTTAAINHDATRQQVEDAINSLTTIDKVSVTFSSGVSACTAAGDNIIAVTFVTDLGGSVHPDAYTRELVPALPRMTVGTSSIDVVIADGWSSGSVTDSATNTFTDVVGSKEYDLCSDRGLCNFETGICQCFLGYGSSNGLGGEGRVGDCGYVEPVIYQDGASFRGRASRRQ